MKLPFTHLSLIDILTLQNIVKQLPAGATCAEIGSYLGASSIVISSGLDSQGTLFCVDTWQNDAMSEGHRDTYQEFLDNTAQHASKIKPIRRGSIDAARQFHESLDFLFIDGDHSYDGCKADLIAWLPKVKLGGVVAFHDVTWAEGVKKTIREEFLPVQAGPCRMIGNIYWAHVGKPEKIGRPVTATACVVSSQSDPSKALLERVTRGLGTNNLLWVLAGPEINKKITAPVHHQVSFAQAEQVGLVSGRHKALKLCNEDVFLFVDDDVTLPPGWLDKMLEPFADPDVHFVGCRYLPDYEHEPPGWMEGLWHEDQGFRTLWQLESSRWRRGK